MIRHIPDPSVDMEEADEEGAGCRQYRALAASKGPVEDLVMLPGPLTEHAVLQALQAHFFNRKFQVENNNLEKWLNDDPLVPYLYRPE